jgi:hypothetical protein
MCEARGITRRNRPPLKRCPGAFGAVTVYVHKCPPSGALLPVTVTIPRRTAVLVGLFAGIFVLASRASSTEFRAAVAKADITASYGSIGETVKWRRSDNLTATHGTWFCRPSGPPRSTERVKSSCVALKWRPLERSDRIARGKKWNSAKDFRKITHVDSQAVLVLVDEDNYGTPPP